MVDEETEMVERPLKILMIAPTSFFSEYGGHIRIYEETRALQAPRDCASPGPTSRSQRNAESQSPRNRLISANCGEGAGKPDRPIGLC